jgi:hypothetical protein
MAPTLLRRQEQQAVTSPDLPSKAAPMRMLDARERSAGGHAGAGYEARWATTRLPGVAFRVSLHSVAVPVGPREQRLFRRIFHTPQWTILELRRGRERRTSGP